MGSIMIGQPIATARAAAILQDALVGFTCTSVDKSEYSWHFGFADGEASLCLECAWRLRSDDSIAYGYQDDGQKFGLAEPVDGVALSKKLIGDSPIVLLAIRDGVGDLSIEFESGVRLDVFNASSGYEGWTFNVTNGLFVVAQGGGKLAVCNPPGGL